jgi:hypothetical protein
VDLVLTFFYAMLPRRHLQQIVRHVLLKRFFPHFDDLLLCKSGRTALSAIFEALARERPGSQVLVPDYICNVVPRAVSRAGLEPLAYRTSQHFEPDLDDFLEKLASPRVGGVLLASLFGAQNTSPEILQRVRAVRADILIVLDECQNLILNNPTRPDSRAVAVFSFNCKTIAGAMGGGVCS